MNAANLPFSAAAERNAGPILDVLQRVLLPQATVLEVDCEEWLLDDFVVAPMLVLSSLLLARDNDR